MWVFYKRYKEKVKNDKTMSPNIMCLTWKKTLNAQKILAPSRLQPRDGMPQHGNMKMTTSVDNAWSALQKLHFLKDRDNALLLFNEWIILLL